MTRYIVYVLILLFLIINCYGQEMVFREDSLYKQGNYLELYKLCNHELKKNKKLDIQRRTILLKYRIDCNITFGKVKNTVKDYSYLIKLDSNDVNNYIGLSYVYNVLNKESSCIYYIRKALAKEPLNVYAMNNIAYYLNQYGDFNESVDFCSKGLSIVKDSILMSALFSNRSYGYFNLKMIDSALSDAESAIKINPNNSFAYVYRALINIQLKNFVNVCSDLTIAKQLGAVILTTNLLISYCNP